MRLDVLHSNGLGADTYGTHVSGAPALSSVRDVAGTGEKGGIWCWWGLEPPQESWGCRWPHGKPWSWRGLVAAQRPLSHYWEQV